MSLLDKASLIITPNSYSEGTLYSAVPADGSGDLSWGRATDAWRTNSAGLVQRVCWNLLQYSEKFENAAWTKSNGTITTNAILAPNGTLTADSFTKTSAINTVSQVGSSSTVFANIGVHTLSVYIKPNIGNEVLLRLDNSGNTANSSFNFTTKTFTNSGANIISSSFVELPNGWFRLSIVGNVTTLGWTVTPCNLFSNPLGDSMFIWGAQLVEGSSALEYFPTTDRQNVPRIDYSLGGCPTLLMEPQRTNICLQSEQISTTPWSNNGGTTTLDAIASPSGIVNADKFNEDASTGQHYIGQQITGLASTTYTMSVYAKKAERDIIYIRCFNSTFGVVYCSVNFNLTTGVATGAGAAIQSVGNGWYRCSISFTTNVDPVIQVRLNMTLDGNYPGVVGNGMYIWGAQLEAGAYPTSYIPTTTASVTRNADSASKSGISSLLGQTEGTVAYKMYLNKTVGGGLQVFSTTANDSNVLFFVGYIGNTGTLTFDFYVGGVYTFSFTYATPLSVGLNRIAIVYKAGAYKLFLNGSLVGTNANSTAITNTISKLNLASAQNPLNGSYYSVIAFKSALSNAECIQLTTI